MKIKITKPKLINISNSFLEYEEIKNCKELKIIYPDFDESKLTVYDVTEEINQYKFSSFSLIVKYEDKLYEFYFVHFRTQANDYEEEITFEGEVEEIVEVRPFYLNKGKENEAKYLQYFNIIT